MFSEENYFGLKCLKHSSNTCFFRFVVPECLVGDGVGGNLWHPSRGDAFALAMRENREW